MSLPRPVDPYRVLGLPGDASLAQIKEAHRRLAKRFHPDAGGGDPDRFLAIQDAYQVLSDPLRRKEWDLRHAPGPIRADQHARRAGRPRATPDPATPGGGTARARGTAGTRSRERGGSGAAGSSDRGRDAAAGSGRDPYADSYTWSAQGVPWWEQDAPPGSGRRAPGRQRPRSGRSARQGEDAADSATGSAGTSERSAGRADQEPDGRTGEASAGPAGSGPADRTAEGPEPRSEFDVFNRSSGAAWSSAARAHFRRATSDMARGAAEPYATRWTTPGGRGPIVRGASGQTAGDRTRADGGAAADAGRQPPAASSGTAPSDGTMPRGPGGADFAGRTGGPAPAPTGGPAPAPPAGTRFGPTVGTRAGPSPAYAGPTAGTRAGPSPAFAGPAYGRPRTPWPTLPERLIFAGLAWVPLALLVAFGGGALSDCADASVACPVIVPPLQAVAVVLLAVGLVALPKVAYVATGAGVGMLLGGLAVLLATGLAGLLASGPAPRPEAAAGASIGVDLAVVTVMIVGYVVAALVVWRDRPLRRPWLTRPSPGGGQARNTSDAGQARPGPDAGQARPS